MNKNTTVTILTGILLALGTGAMAQSALQQLGAEAGDDTVALAQQFKDVRAMNAGPAPVIDAPAADIERSSKDVFENCGAFEAKSFAPWNVSQAAILVQTCLNHDYAADGDYQVTAQVARFGSRACPEGPRSCKAVMEVVGLKLVVTGRIMDGNPVLLDLNSSLEQRGGKLMGFEAIVDNEAEIAN